MAYLLKQLCQQETHPNSVHEAGPNALSDVFSQAGFFGFRGNDRTLARMSTGTLLGVMPGCPLGPFWLHLAVWWGPFGHLGAPGGSLWGALGYLVASLFFFNGGHFLSKCVIFWIMLLKFKWSLP